MKVTSRHPEKRSERLELRLTFAHRTALGKIALDKRRTMSSLVEELIEKLIAENP